MPFGLPSMASAYQRNMRRVLAAQEARYHAVLEEMETVFKEPLRAPRASRGSGPRWLVRSHSFAAYLQLPQLSFVSKTR